jgi:putative inorganic carbon (hco3(-)) transporter
VPLRDLFLFLLLAVLVVAAIRRPYIGVLGWVLFSVMNPHRLAWGPAYDFQFAQLIAIATLVGLLFSRDERVLKGGTPAVILVALFAWCLVNTVMALSPAASWQYLDRVYKTMLMLAVLLLALSTRRHAELLLATIVLSLGFYGVKGGIFTLSTGGNFHVNGPPDSVMEGNNSLGVGLVVLLPLLYYLYQQAPRRLWRLALGTAIGLCAISVLGTYSRGALLGIGAMAVFLWLRSARKMPVAVGALAFILLAVPFMPDHWTARMQSITEYEEDASASYRLVAWEAAYNLAVDRFPLGGGFEWQSPATSARYSPMPDLVMVPHSIYFEALGTQGFIGLGLFILFWMAVWFQCAWMRRQCRHKPELAWAHQLASMVQVSIVGYAVGGTFLNLAFWDLPYYIYGVVAVAHFVVRRELSAQASKKLQPAQAADLVTPGAVRMHVSAGEPVNTAR